MRVLFDQGTPAPLRNALNNHEVTTAFERGWQLLQNGELLLAAEAAGFEAIVTTDQNLRYQQNLKDRRIAILVFSCVGVRRNCSTKPTLENEGAMNAFGESVSVHH